MVIVRLLELMMEYAHCLRNIHLKEKNYVLVHSCTGVYAYSLCLMISCGFNVISDAVGSSYFGVAGIIIFTCLV